MIFEKALSMAQNIEIQRGSHLNNHYMLIADLAETRMGLGKKRRTSP